jgi:adenylate cyclase
MRIPFRLPERSTLKHVAAVGAVAVLAVGLATLLRQVQPMSAAMARLDDQFYDAFYRWRPAEPRAGGELLIIGVDDDSLNRIDQALGRGWPWPRDIWGKLVEYLDRNGARAVMFDLLFTRKSVLRYELDDDTTLAQFVDQAKVPVIFAAAAQGDGSWPPFAPPVKKPLFGAANVSTDDHSRDYAPTVHGLPSLALQTLRAAGVEPKLDPNEVFRLHYYGPYRRSDGTTTFAYQSAAPLVALMTVKDEERPAREKEMGIDPSRFRGKIVLIGALAGALYDVKSSPLDNIYPGVCIHATAIENLALGQRVGQVGLGLTTLVALAGAMLGALAAIAPRDAWLKVLLGLTVLAAMMGVALWLFVGSTIRWLPLSVPLVGILAAVVLGMGWSYFVEDKQRRFFLKVLSQSVSPTVAAEVARTGRLDVGGQRREMSVLFTDIADFTTIAESIGADRISAMLNDYLEEMSGIVLALDGTIDKYIGDAIMSFWNAPLDQGDHALRACRAALGMMRRESEIQPQLQAFGAKRIKTRFGVNTGPMAVGFMGSTKRSSYTVLGDAVNLGSRLEGTNKFYGTRILIAEPTAELVRDQFLLRQVDVIRVKGKVKPMAIFELLGEANQEPPLVSLVQRYEQALAFYRARQWDRAESLLLEVQRDFAEDMPTRVILGRIAEFRRQPPPGDWDGVHVQTEK